MAIIVTVPTVVVVLPLLILVAVAWWLLGTWLMKKADPYVRNWAWHRAGGEGDCPSDEELGI